MKCVFTHYLDTLHVSVAVFLQIVLPIGIALGLVGAGIEVDATGDAISFISIIAGLMCSVAALLFDVRTSIMREDKATRNRDEASADELFYICCWLILIGIVGAFWLLLHTFECPFTFPSIAIKAYYFIYYLILTHFVAVMVTFTTRLVRIYEGVATHRG